METGVLESSLKSLRNFLSPSQKRYGILMLFILLFNSIVDIFGLAALVPTIMVAAEPGAIFKNKYLSYFYNSLGYTSEKSFLASLIIIILVLFVIKNVFAHWSSNLQVRFTAEIGLDLTKRQMAKYLNFPFWYFNDIGYAQIANSCMTVPISYVNGVLRPLLVVLSEIVIIVIITAGIVLYKPILIILLAVILAPTTWLLYRNIRTRALAIGNRLNELAPFAAGKMNDIFIGNAELKLANRINFFRDEVLESQDEVQQLSAESYLYSLLPLRVIEVVAILGVVTIFMYALFSPSNSTGLITLVGLFAAAAYRLMPSINRILTALVQMRQSQFSINNIASYSEPHYNEAPHPDQQPLPFQHTVEFDNVGFTFPQNDSPALQHISLRVRKGEKIGFIGSSGSGKTTLMNLLLRFYTEQEGTIKIDGQPLSPRNLQAWHGIVGYVKQDTFLMEASIKNNVTLNDVNVDEKRLKYALEQASLQGFVDSLPDGADTFIGERGSKLSGGQRQRIGIARALYKHTQVLVLDEATSALDNQTEREVNEAINKLSATDMTIFIIAHRITTLRECDRIYELSNGRLVGEHTYADLTAEAQ